MIEAGDRGAESAVPRDAPVAIICGGGSLPFAVADAAIRRGNRVMLLALRGSADPQRVTAYPHHWISLGQVGRCWRLAREAGCRDVVFIGSIVRPTVAQLRLDLTALRLLPRMLPMFRGGDSRLLREVGRVFE